MDGVFPILNFSHNHVHVHIVMCFQQPCSWFKKPQRNTFLMVFYRKHRMFRHSMNWKKHEEPEGYTVEAPLSVTRWNWNTALTADVMQYQIGWSRIICGKYNNIAGSNINLTYLKCCTHCCTEMVRITTENFTVHALLCFDSNKNKDILPHTQWDG
jgi:hypothetical protein